MVCPPAESELVAGFFTEHSAVTFALFFLAEFTNILAIATLFSLLFFGVSLAWHLPLVLVILWLRASLARMRFDQLLSLGWKAILPLAIGLVLAIINLLFLAI
jgi:NADH-quinone oxidoreductase subunit H